MSKRIIALALLGAGLIAGPASATTWSYTGAITSCNAGVCGLAGIGTGDPVVGSLSIDVGASDAFTLPADLITFGFLVGSGPGIPVLPMDVAVGMGLDFWTELAGPGTTDAAGDFLTGGVTGTFVGGTLGSLGGGVFICLDAAGCGDYSLNTGAFTGTLDQGDFLVTVGFGTSFVAEVEGTFVQQQPVPVPAAVWLMGSAILGLAGLRRRKTA